MTFISSTLATVSNHLKPHKAEAVQRIRTNGLCLLATFVLSYLLPVPSLLTALRTLLSSSRHQRWSSGWFWECICLLEIALVTVLGYNVLEASYAIKYPRAPLPPITSPIKPKTVVSGLSTPGRPFKVLSPNSSPQVQKPFAFTPGASTSRSLTSASLAMSASSPGGLANKTYAQSPVSTPSRVINYGSLPHSSSTNTMASSTSEFLATPSPVISAYRGKHSGMDVGRALDGSYLNRIIPEPESDDD